MPDGFVTDVAWSRCRALGTNLRTARFLVVAPSLRASRLDFYVPQMRPEFHQVGLPNAEPGALINYGSIL
jgi:hypothetical protein